MLGNPKGYGNEPVSNNHPDSGGPWSPGPASVRSAGVRGGRRRPNGPVDPWAVLGLEPHADADRVVAARKALARSAHPDAGGSVEAMQRLNAAVDAALAQIGAAAPSPPVDSRRRRGPDRQPPPRGGVRHDHPSFTIEALPAEAFEGLLIAAATLGEIVDDDPPYLLEVVMSDPVAAWCRLEIVPDAGAATISITTARLPGHPTPDVFDVRDGWIDTLNQLDWAETTGRQPPS